MLLALDLPHSEFIVPGIIFLIFGVGLITLARFWPDSARPVATVVGPVETRRVESAPRAGAPVADAAVAELEPAPAAQPNSAPEPIAATEPRVAAEPLAAPVPIGTSEPLAATEPIATPEPIAELEPAVVVPPAIAWPLLIDPDAGRLSEAERVHVIEGLGVAGDAWCLGVLQQAYAEEDGELRVAVVDALAACRGEAVAAALAAAYASPVIAERYAAVDGASRRADVDLLTQALADADGTIALAAAYGLQRAGRGDITDAALAHRADATANDIRSILPLLA